MSDIVEYPWVETFGDSVSIAGLLSGEFPVGATVRELSPEELPQQPPRETSGCVRLKHPGPVQCESVSGTVKKSRVRASKEFFITIGFPSFYPEVRTDLLDNFHDYESFCIAVEKHKENAKNDIHVHCYIKFIDNIFITDLSDHLRCIYQGLSVDVQKCKSKRNTLKYITKEDKDALHNVSVDSLSFFYRLHYWGKHTNYFRFDDPFVVEHKHIYRYLQSAFYDIKNAANDRILAPYWGCRYGNWSDDVISWYNNFLSQVGRRRKQLYLWGGTGTGKSTLVEKVIGERYLKYVFWVGDGRFAFDGLRLDFHKIIVFEEFDWEEWKHKTRYLKRLLEGRSFSADLKGNTPAVIEWLNKPVIMISNECNITDEAIIDRLQIVFTGDIKYYLGNGVVVKEEVSEQVQEVPSEEIYISD